MTFSFLVVMAAIFCCRLGSFSMILNHNSSKQTLPSSTRLFSLPLIRNLNLFKAADSLTTSQCPSSTLIHRTVGRCTKSSAEVRIIPHEAIFHDGVQCGTGKRSDYLVVVLGKDVIDARTARTNGLLPIYGVLSSNARAINAFTVLQGLHPVYVGVEINGPRICNDVVVYNKDALFFFLQPEDSTQDLNFGFAYLGSTEVGVISVRVDEQLCLFKESRRLGPGQPEFLTPTPTPRISSPLSSTIFDLDDPANIEPCFPVTDDTATIPTTNAANPSSAATPVPQVLFSASPSPSSSPLVSVAATTSFNATATQSTAASGTVQLSPSTSADATMSPTLPPGDRPTEDGGNDSVCFPSGAKVVLSSGHVMPISKLKIGDEVLTGLRTYSRVIMFTHHTDSAHSKFVRITTTSNASLALTPGHYLPVNGTLRAARSLQIGDTVLLADGRRSRVIMREEIFLAGLHNPQTMDGQLVVDGIIASTFTQAVRPSIAVSLLAPVRFLYSVFPSCTMLQFNLMQGSNFFASILPSGALKG